MTQEEAMELWGKVAKYAPSEARIYEFAKLVAKHTLSNIDPSKFMSCQEVVEAARLAEREACAKVCEETGTVEQWDGLSEAADRIRARGEQA